MGTLLPLYLVFIIATVFIVSSNNLLVFGNNNTVRLESSPIVKDAEVNTTTPIKNLVVMIQGKRSFDNYFGVFPGVNGITNNTQNPINPFKNEESVVSPFPLEITEMPRYKPYHNTTTYRLSFNDGKMDGFIYSQKNSLTDGKLVMGYFDGDDLPYYWKLAEKYVLADMFFSPSMYSDLANNLILIASHEGTYASSKKAPKGGILVNYTIFDLLEKNNIPWNVYIQDLASFENLTNVEKIRLYEDIPVLGIKRFMENKTLNLKIKDLNQYFEDIKSGNLPSISYIYTTSHNEDAPNNVIRGQEEVTFMISSLKRTNYWNTSAIILTYVESGGWFDHVKPPKIGKYQLGFRVPTLIISPYSKEGFIDSTIYDGTSILKFIEYNYNLTHLTDRDKFVNNLLNSFNFSHANTPIILKGIGDTKLIASKTIWGVSYVYIGFIVVAVIIGFIIHKLTRKNHVK